MTGVDWSAWSVILLKPDCLQRGLAEEVLGCLSRQVRITARRVISPTEEQVFAHYDDLLPPQVSQEFGLDVPAALRRLYVGARVMVALGHGPDAAARLRTLIGPTDPGIAADHTIRGRFGVDDLATARAEGRLINNLIHTSDHAGVVERDFAIWYGPGQHHLLTPAADGSTT
ncbi:nucleoside diphosphate kinase [Planobispora rosea]|uniref:nucleoside-diphosphate kinase n=1 Tax=Planobispora rosea TaxID=35762 RepID=A0A8J3WG30_PLARO|nr:nucleoside-diphosphate kinase [Planobispora rosea]GGS98901.1 nucleoside diphosphate kinase [Planobispora rosea]GIH87993.1 nucleoside diphosphate kinase [Planobispora rosea]